MSDILAGPAYCCGPHILAYDIIPMRFKSSAKLDAKELGSNVFADLDPLFGPAALRGEYQIVVAGRNFGGGGKSIEGPVFALKGAGVKVVLADSFSRFFFRNAINNGLPVLVYTGITEMVRTGDQLEVDLSSGRIINRTQGTEVQAVPLSQTARAILKAGGAVPYLKAQLTKTSG